MTKTLIHTYTVAHTYRRSITSILVAACIMSVLFYIANLYSIISHTVALQKIGQDTKILNTKVQELDAQYLAISKTITPDIIKSHGYDQVPVSAFISRSQVESVAIAGYEF